MSWGRTYGSGVPKPENPWHMELHELSVALHSTLSSSKLICLFGMWMITIHAGFSKCEALEAVLSLGTRIFLCSLHQCARLEHWSIRLGSRRKSVQRRLQVTEVTQMELYGRKEANGTLLQNKQFLGFTDIFTWNAGVCLVLALAF